MSLSYSPTDTPIALINESKTLYLDRDGFGETKTSYMDMQLSEDQVVDLGGKILKGLTIRQAVAEVDELLSEDGENKEIELEPGDSIQVLPSEKSERVLVAGPSGRGKSTWACGYGKKWLENNPDGDIWIFVRTVGDPAFKGLDYNEVQVEKVDDLSFEIEDFSNSLCIFDDMEHITDDKKKKKAIQHLMNDLITNGRKLGIYTMCLSHTLMKGTDSKVINNEANKIVLFPGGGDRQNLKFLQEYAGMQLNEARMIISVRSRWICLDQSMPRYLVHEKGVILL